MLNKKVDQPWHFLPVVEPTAGAGFLAGVRVLDLSTSISGPYATMMLSDFGADVIKIERPGGDDTRTWGPPFLEGESLWFTSVNRNKKSAVLDLARKRDHDALLTLIRQADVVVTNFPVGVQAKLGLDYESVSRLSPGIIFASITGFGLSGERADLTCYDLIAEGYSGVMDVTGAADGPPQKVGAPAADMLAGQDLAFAVVCALLERARSGKGHLIDVSLVESMTRFMSCRISSYLGSGEVPKRSGGTDSVIAIYQPFDTADRPLTLALGNDGIWQRFWEAVGDTGFARNLAFETNASRRAHRVEITAHIQGILRRQPRDVWLKRFAEARVPAGPINDVEEVVADMALQERGLFFSLREEGRTVPQVGMGIHMNGTALPVRSAPPLLGEHTQEVLARGFGVFAPDTSERN